MENDKHPIIEGEVISPDNLTLYRLSSICISLEREVETLKATVKELKKRISKYDEW